jgi:hypothetical protein
MNIFSAFKLGLGTLSIGEKLAALGVVLLLLFSSYAFVGHHYYKKGEAISAIQISKYESAIHDLQAKKSQGQVVINDRIVTKYVDRIRNVDRIVNTNHDVIQRVIVDRPSTFSLGWIDAHNQSALGLAIDPAKAANADASGITDKAALDIIASNYQKYHQCQIVVDGWKEWYGNTSKLYQDSNSKVPQEKK